jgi:lysophospholipase L1-like esterase
MRNPMDRTAAPASFLRLLAVGDCNTGGAEGAPLEERITERLAAQFAARGIECRVQNLGFTMNTTREGVPRMERHAEPADLVLINFGLVDAWVTSLPGFYLSYYPDNRGKRWARKALKWVKRRLKSPLLRSLVPLGEVVPIDEYEQQMRRMLAIARAGNPEVKIVLWGTVPVPGDEPRTANIARYNERLRGIAASEQNVWYLDPGPLIQGLSQREAYRDHVHLTRLAAERIAVAVVQLYATWNASGAGRGLRDEAA